MKIVQAFLLILITLSCSTSETENLTKEFDSNDQLIAEYEMSDTIKSGIGKHYNNGELDFKTIWIENQQSLIIEDISGDNKLLIKHTFPDTLYSGDILKAEIYSKNDKWAITESYISCPIGSDGIFRKFHRFSGECSEFLVVNNRTQIQFTTLGIGQKRFTNVTLILENEYGIFQATELEFPYFLKEKKGL